MFIEFTYKELCTTKTRECKALLYFHITNTKSIKCYIAKYLKIKLQYLIETSFL